MIKMGKILDKLDDCYYSLEEIFDDISEIREMIDSLF